MFQSTTFERTWGISTLVLVASAIGCSPKTQPNAPAAAAVSSSSPAVPVAAESAKPADPNGITTAIESRSNSTATGTVTLTAANPGVHVVVAVSGVTPGPHGLHFHENGDCSAPDAMSAKGHFNPEHHDHGLPPTAVRHLGDLGNIQVAPDGTGRLEIQLADASLEPGVPNSLHGKAIILHEKVDDGGQPVGNAGSRIGCAVIP